MADFVGSLANASTMRGNRSVYSAPLREEKRTRAPTLITWNRNPSHFGSCTQPSPCGGRTDAEGDSGRINERRMRVTQR